MPVSWDAFLTRYSPMARAIARGLARPPSLAEDVVQEASLVVFRAWKADPGRFATSEALRGYFLRTTRNLALKTRRTAGRETSGLDPQPIDEAAPEARAVRERQDRLAQVLETLDPEARTWIRRRFVERRTLAELAHETGTPLSTLHSRERALLARLREHWEREEDR